MFRISTGIRHPTQAADTFHAQMDSGKGGAPGTGRYPNPDCKPCSGPSL